MVFYEPKHVAVIGVLLKSSVWLFVLLRLLD